MNNNEDINRELENNTDCYRKIFEYSSNGIFVVDVVNSHRFKYRVFNPAEEQSVGLKAEQVIGKFVEEIFDEKLAEHFNCNFRKCCEQGVTINYEEECLLPSGSAYFNTSLIPIKDSNGEVIRILGIASDVTKMTIEKMALQEQMTLEIVISEIARLFVSQDKVNMNEILKIIGEAISVNHIYVFKLAEDGNKINILNEWFSDNTDPQMAFFQNLDLETFPWWITQLKGGNNIILSNIEDLPSEAVREKRFLQEQDAKSVFVAPVCDIKGMLAGFIGFSDTEIHRKWLDKETDVLHVIGEMIGMYWNRQNVEDQLKESLQNIRTMIYDHEAVMLLIEPLSGKIIEANRAAMNFYGYSKKELLNMCIQDINILNKEEMTALRMTVLNKGQTYFTFPHRLKSGEIKTVDVYSSPVDYFGQKVLYSIIFDVTNREEIAKENEYLAYHDYLTGLYNRRFLEKEFERRVKKGEWPVSILIGDIDRFKDFNDSYGHAEGDRVLKEIATKLNELINDRDILVRASGDEFIIIVSGKNEREIRHYLDKIEKITYNAFKEILDGELITISWGYGIQKNKEDTMDALNQEAEAFMYNRKFYNHNSARGKTVDVIMNTLFAKSAREEAHSERVSNLCEVIARRMNLRQSEIDKVRVTALLHDIGKIGIDEKILNKNGKLDTTEWEIMKLHSAKGASILEKTIEYKDIADVVLSHHERYDGTGYPRGLKAKAIPYWARIIAVADTYDAMTNVRSYRQSVSKEEAIAELKKCSGTQFDTQIVDLVVEIINEQKALL